MLHLPKTPKTNKQQAKPKPNFRGAIRQLLLLASSELQGQLGKRGKWQARSGTAI
jgi:hypothetical protein